MGQANALVVVGDTDHWSASRRSPAMVVDHRLRLASGAVAGGSFAAVLGTVSRTPAFGSWYAEIVAVESGGGAASWRCGIAQATTTWALNTTGGERSDVVLVSMGGAITANGGTVQSGLAAMAPGDVVGVQVYESGGLGYVQFWRNGATYGSAVQIAQVPWLLCANVSTTPRTALLRSDADDLSFRPTGSQPWGAAARVAIVGGYSTPTDGLDVVHADVTVHVRRTALCAVAGRSARGQRTPAGGLRYVEFAIDVVATTTSALAVGVASTSLTLASQVGAAATGWSYRANGTRFHAGASNATGFSYTTGDRPGLIWNASTGHIWLTKNGAVLAGNPEAGTGAYWTNATGAIVPALTPGDGGRVRVATHAREQQYRPAYCQAWDGGDALPEQHYRGVLRREVEITTGIWFPFPWGGSRGGSPIGSVDIDNADGRYDAVSDWDLRDQDLSVYELDADGWLTNEARAVCDSVELGGQSTLRVLARGVDALLDRRVEQPIVAAGALACVPATPVEDESLSYNVSASPLNVSLPFPLSDLLVYDQGLVVASHRRGDADKVRGFVRTVNPAGKQSLRNLLVARRGADYTLTNAGFDAWVGDNPTGWTVVETGPNALITQNGSACRFLRNAGAPEASIRQSLGFNALGGGRIFVDVRVSARVSGSLTARIWTAAGVPVTKSLNITGTGRWIGYLPWAAGPNSTAFIQLQADDTTDLTVDSLEVYRADHAYGLDDLVRYVLEELGGLLASRWAWASNSSPSGSLFAGGVWSDRQPTVRELLGLVLDSVLCSYYTDPEGRLVLSKLDVFDVIAPTPVSAVLAERDVIGPIQVRDDLAPDLSDAILWSVNHAIHSEAELAGGVGTSERAFLASTGYVRRISDALPLVYHPFYGHAVGAPPRPTAWAQIAGKAAAESDIDSSIVAALERGYGVRRRFYEATVRASAVRGVRPGAKVNLTHSRFGLASGNDLMLVRSRRRPGAPTTTVTLWG